MNWHTATRYFIGIALAAIVVFDVLALIFGGYEATISRAVLGFATANPIVALVGGILVGHLFIPDDASKRRDLALICLVVAGVAFMVVPIVTAAALCFGAAIGARFWSQPKPPPDHDPRGWIH